MKENKNNELKKDSLEQVAGGFPGSLRDIDNQLVELNRILENEYAARRSALKRLDTSPGADLIVKLCEVNIEDLQRLIHKKLEERAAILEDMCDMR